MVPRLYLQTVPTAACVAGIEAGDPDAFSGPLGPCVCGVLPTLRRLVLVDWFGAIPCSPHPFRWEKYPSDGGAGGRVREGKLGLAPGPLGPVNPCT